MGIFDIFKKKVVVEEEVQVNQTEEFAFNVAHATYGELLADNNRLKEIIWQLEMAHTDNQVIINAMDSEIAAIRKTLDDHRSSYTETYNENRRLQSFYRYFDNLRGKGLEVTNWHRLKPMDEYIAEAKEGMEVDSVD